MAGSILFIGNKSYLDLIYSVVSIYRVKIYLKLGHDIM